ncbi:hypothetical protein BDV93DRAFT_604646 [Ceratobasidium sp. AG-I]|nr:hypothetical protein BDV93DRAFT_604646 [Ceratobasidium sp. AG-I]
MELERGARASYIAPLESRAWTLASVCFSYLGRRVVAAEANRAMVEASERAREKSVLSGAGWSSPPGAVGSGSPILRASMIVAAVHRI